MKKLPMVFCIMALIFVMTNMANADPVQWAVGDGGNGHWYDAIDVRITWQEAKILSESMGGYLATLTTQEEDEFVYNNLIQSFSQDCWLGGTDEVVEGVWQWITGETWGYANWDTGEPNDGTGSGQDYLNIYASGVWDDAGPPGWPYDSLPFVIEWDSNPVPIRNPVANAGWNNFARVQETVTLDGSTSLDPSGGQLSYLWTEDPNNPVTGLISGGNQDKIDITPTLKGDYLFKLEVSNANGQATDTVVIHVIDPGDIPEGEAISGILDTYQAYKIAYESKDIDAVMDLYHPDYWDGSWQDGPRDKQIQREILEEKFNNFQTLKIDHNIYSANLRGPSEDNLIEGDLFLFQTIYQTDLQGKESQPRDSYSTKIKKDEQTGKWLFYGDQKPFGAYVQSVYGKDEWGPWTGVWIGVRADRWDPNQGAVTNPITSVHLQGPTLPQAGIDLDYNSPRKRWDLWRLLTEDPSVGWTYVTNVYRNDLTSSTRTIRITNVLEGYPIPLYPASPGYPQVPEYGVSLEPVFQWSDQFLKDQLYYRVDVSTSRGYEYVIWQRYDIKGRGVRYNDDNLGVPLEPDQLYYWRVRARDKDINGATSDWQIFFTEPTDGKYTPRVEAHPRHQGVITYRYPDGSLYLRFLMRAYDPDGSINEGDLIAYGPGTPSPLNELGSFDYDGYGKRWYLYYDVTGQTNLSGTYTVRVTDTDQKSSEFNEWLDFDPLPSAPAISFPKDDIVITNVVPKLEWSIPPGATRTWIEIRDASNRIIFDLWVIGDTEFQLPGGILAPEQNYRWYAWAAREEDNGEVGITDNAAFSGWAYFSVGQVVEEDTDGDGLFNSIEAIIGTNPNDKDTDDDGLMDGDEDKNHNGVVEPSLGETNPNDPDSDDDFVQDGTEKGITVATSDTDTSIFKPDADSNTTTNPLYWDSDYDGLPDGVEDDGECNPAHAQNGRLDNCETDPLDDDTDDDGLTDGPWGSEDMNANGHCDPGETDAVDADTDDDGIQDGTEKGLTEPEGTGTDTTVFIPDEDPWTTTDPADADSDGDGVPDGEEDLNKNGKTDEGETSADVLTVKMDICPENCPNYLDVGSKGVLPIAVLGSGDFDVTQIEPGTVSLEDVVPKRWNVEDVTVPHDCLYNYEYPDGELDLTLKFDRQAIISTLGEVNNGVEINLTLTGDLNSGEPFEAIDSVIIVKE